MNAKSLSATIGFLLMLEGVVGFFVPNLFGLNLTLAHNVVHLVIGFFTLLIAMSGTTAAVRAFCIGLALAYGLIGIAGIVAGTSLTLIPNQLVFERPAHVAHLILSGLFLIAAFARRPAHKVITANR